MPDALGPASEPKRFWAKVRVVGECWIWQAATKDSGYGVFWWDGKLMPAHRFAYELLVDRIPEDHDLHHLPDVCTSKACVNPAHLEPLLHKDHTVLGNVPRPTCNKGHERTPENTTRNKRGDQVCIPCRAARQKGYYYA